MVQIYWRNKLAIACIQFTSLDSFTVILVFNVVQLFQSLRLVLKLIKIPFASEFKIKIYSPREGGLNCKYVWNSKPELGGILL